MHMYVLVQVRVAFSLMITKGRDMGACQVSGPRVRMYASINLAELYHIQCVTFF